MIGEKWNSVGLINFSFLLLVPHHVLQKEKVKNVLVGERYRFFSVQRVLVEDKPTREYHPSSYSSLGKAKFIRRPIFDIGFFSFNSVASLAHTIHTTLFENA